MTPQSALAPSAPDTRFFGHPRGLATLFFTEMWERFSYYGMRALLILFITTPVARGGLGFSVARAGVIYGLYTSMVYLMCVPGGWMADRLFGQRRAVLYGGMLIVMGHVSLAVRSLPFFYSGLALLVVGTGLLKPNVSTIVGQLYQLHDHRRDAGFSIFYMGINLGAFLGPIVVGYVGQRVNWHVGFLLAGIGMTAGLTQYWFGSRFLGSAGLSAKPERGAQQKLHRNMWIGAAALVILMGALLLAANAGWIEITTKMVGDAGGLLLLAVTIAAFAWLFANPDWTPLERRRLIAVAVLFVASALFFAAYEQAGSTLSLLADRGTRDEMFGIPFPSSWFQALPALFVISLAPAFAWLWIRLGRREPSTPVKFALGLLLVGLGYVGVGAGTAGVAAGVRISPLWLSATYLLHVCGELCLSPVGLSVTTKLAPARIAGMMMGLFLLSISIGDYVAGRFASLYETYSPPFLFAVVAGFTISLGLVLLVLVKPIKRLMGGVN